MMNKRHKNSDQHRNENSWARIDTEKKNDDNWNRCSVVGKIDTIQITYISPMRWEILQRHRMYLWRRFHVYPLMLLLLLFYSLFDVMSKSLFAPNYNNYNISMVRRCVFGLLIKILIRTMKKCTIIENGLWRYRKSFKTKKNMIWSGRNRNLPIENGQKCVKLRLISWDYLVQINTENIFFLAIELHHTAAHFLQIFCRIFIPLWMSQTENWRFQQIQ